MEIIGQCDIVVAAENAIFMNPHVRGWAISYLHMAVYNAGIQWTKMLMFTGDPISGKQAERIGLVVKAVPEDKLEEEVNKLAMRIALVPSELLALNKAIINRVVEEMGVRNVLNAGLELDVIARTKNPFIEEFRKMAEEKGWEAAYDAVEAPFKALPKSFQEDS